MAFSTIRLREPTRLQVFSRNYRARLATPQKRFYADDALSAEINAKDSTPGRKTGWFFVETLFPVRLTKYDPRYYFANLRKDTIIERVKTVLESTNVHGFKVLDIEPRIKDGGVFVHFEYISPLGSGASEDPAVRLTELKAMADLQAAIQTSATKQGGIPSWLGFSAPRKFWLVRGRPWREDMDRFASAIIKTEFDGPDVHLESLYDVLRPYGRITKLDPPTPAPQVLCVVQLLHTTGSGPGIALSAAPGTKLTRLSMLYEQPIKENAIRNWLANHPRIVLPVLAFLIGTITYTVFDPIRELSVQGKVMNWFDYRDYALYKWIRENTYERIASTFSSKRIDGGEVEEPAIWKERKDAKVTLRAYLNDFPTTVAVIHGPAGAGKGDLVDSIMKEEDRPSMRIDCAKIMNAPSDSGIVRELAKQIGYWPYFSFLTSLNNMIDLASVGLIGQKAGFSTTTETQLRDILNIADTALRRVREVHERDTGRDAQRAHIISRRKARNSPQAVEPGADKSTTMTDEKAAQLPSLPNFPERTPVPVAGRSGLEEVLDDLPIVLITNYQPQGAKREDLLNVLAEWAAKLVEDKVAHVIFVCINRENTKRVAKALPSKPLTSIALSDADADTALKYVTWKLSNAGVAQSLHSYELKTIEKLGGRISDLDTLVAKVRNGQSITDAVDEIIHRGISEMRKNAFGDDLEDAKSLPWTREQAWSVLRALAAKDEIPYADVLLEFPFKGDELALRNMESAELISIGTIDGRPTTIKPGKPVYKHVYRHLVEDRVFQAVQTINFNEKLIATSVVTIKSCEDELTVLKNIGLDLGSSVLSGKGATGARASYLLEKMMQATLKVEQLEGENTKLKKVLAKGTFV
ncbi:Mitochondrial escape protein 2 [Rhizoctonia solani]|uniref:Mitochondrial escape protein 2 n=1 Tax=Rhizoctonia solani TaxID=456999 RepID=A0A0K6GC45_9AGAM|nr:Mitochondrial escape protein 2 [Rhizoctonia solani]